MTLYRLICTLFITGLLFGAQTLRAAEPIWIDVRTTEEYQESSIFGHPNILHTEIGDKIATLTTDKSAPIYLYCASGRRAGIAKGMLEQMGYTNVTNAGGIKAVKEQFKIE